MIGRILIHKKQAVISERGGVSAEPKARSTAQKDRCQTAKRKSAVAPRHAVASSGGFKSMTDRQSDQLLVDRVNAGEKHAF